MKLNDIECTNYLIDGNKLKAELKDTTFDNVLNINASEIKITSDEGIVHTVFSNYAIANISYSLEDEIYYTTFIYDKVNISINELLSVYEELAIQNESISEVLDALLMGDIEL